MLDQRGGRAGGQGLGGRGARWEQGQCRLRFKGHGNRQESFGSVPGRPWGSGRLLLGILAAARGGGMGWTSGGITGMATMWAPRLSPAH